MTQTGAPQASTLRAQLLSPRAADRVQALHLIEQQAEGLSDSALRRELQQFVSRGVPYFAPEALSYQAWVARALVCWERAWQAPRAAVVAAPVHTHRQPRPERLRVARALACG
jgi:hypothetical protein